MKFLNKLIVKLVGIFFRIWMSTLRIYSQSEFPKGTYVLGVWHQDLPTSLWYFRNIKMTLFMSQSRDADHFAELLKSLNYLLVRGSSSRGQSNLRHMLRALKTTPIGMAIDGPRGPALQAKPGTEWLVESSNKPYIYCDISYSKYWRLKTWDRMILPKPFSKVQIELIQGGPKAGQGLKVDLFDLKAPHWAQQN